MNSPCRCNDGVNEETAGILSVMLRLLVSVSDGQTITNTEITALEQRIERARRPNGETS